MRLPVRLAAPILAALALASCSEEPRGPREVSGVYPHLTMHNRQGECGTGAVVPWAGRLWVVTYGEHFPDGSSDRLWEIDDALGITPRPESVGGTPANRMIHRETGQLLIGPYVIGADRAVRVIPPAAMRGRLTGNARHLTEPAEKAYYATMEEGLYEVDLRTLGVRELIADGNPPKRGAAAGPPDAPGRIRSRLPGYHGKGLYSGQGRVVYANNGEHHPRVGVDPTIPSGALAEWRGEGDWSLVRRAQFTEVTGPGGLEGNGNPGEDPIWSVGWDAKSLLLMALHRGEWTSYRLPKPSHSYDGSHGWNTEWPRIRDIGEGDLLMTMHGAFWRFPRGFRPGATGGLAPRSAYLRVVGDFARWGDRVVLGCDDHARKEFLNNRPLKSEHGAPMVSHSNLWFVEPGLLDRLGPVVARGSAWLREDVAPGAASDPFLVGGFEARSLVLAHAGDRPARFAVEIDAEGDGAWRTWREAEVAAGGAAFLELPRDLRATWARVRAADGAAGATAHFHCREVDRRPARNGAAFAGLSRAPLPGSGGTLRSLSPDRLGWLGSDGTLRLLGRDLALAAGGTDEEKARVAAARAPAAKSISRDEASLVVEEDGRRWRLPVGEPALADPAPGARVVREVATERDLMNLGGTFFELPARNAQGMAKVRPVATHGLAIGDFCGQFGLLVMTGVSPGAKGGRVARAPDGAALWMGVIDDLWQMGRPRGTGGPWKASAVKAGEPSDPYLLTGYQARSVTVETRAGAEVTLEVDLDGTGVWVEWTRVRGEPGKARTLAIPDSLGAYWIRARADREDVATVQLDYR